MIMRGVYPFFLGTEYLPEESMQLAKFPVPHLDLQNIELQIIPLTYSLVVMYSNMYLISIELFLRYSGC